MRLSQFHRGRVRRVLRREERATQIREGRPSFNFRRDVDLDDFGLFQFRYFRWLHQMMQDDWQVAPPVLEVFRKLQILRISMAPKT